jgi:hypothetical protein
MRSLALRWTIYVVGAYAIRPFEPMVETARIGTQALRPYRDFFVNIEAIAYDNPPSYVQ